MKGSRGFVVAAAVLFAGCVSRGYVAPSATAAATETAPKPPWTVPVAIGTLSVSVPAGAQVGHQWNGKVGMIPVIEYHWGSNATVDPAALRQAALELLSMERFDIADASSGKPRFVIDGVVTSLAYDTYVNAFPNGARAKVTVSWTLRDTTTGSVVYTGTGEDDQKLNGDGAETLVIPAAVRGALTRSFGDPAFRTLVKKPAAS